MELLENKNIYHGHDGQAVQVEMQNMNDGNFYKQILSNRHLLLPVILLENLWRSHLLCLVFDVSKCF
jgi:hypothetical protein